MTSTTVLDANAFDARARDALVLSLFEGLRPGESFVVLTSPGAEALCDQLNTLSDSLRWEFLEKKPSQWKLRVEKLDQDENMPQHGGCCGGGCGGGR